MVPGSLDLGIEVIVATFHGVGGDPTSSDILKMVSNSGLPVAQRFETMEYVTLFVSGAVSGLCKRAASSSFMAKGAFVVVSSAQALATMAAPTLARSDCLLRVAAGRIDGEMRAAKSWANRSASLRGAGCIDRRGGRGL